MEHEKDRYTPHRNFAAAVHIADASNSHHRLGLVLTPSNRPCAGNHGHTPSRSDPRGSFHRWTDRFEGTAEEARAGARSCEMPEVCDWEPPKGHRLSELWEQKAKDQPC
ncbi:MAG: hypothetical protein ACLP7P_06965 [Rhodomicrobium sp.]